MLYFQSYSNLASDPQAMLYAAIINSKSQWKAVWPHYQKNIQEFAFRHRQPEESLSQEPPGNMPLKSDTKWDRTQ